MTDDEKERIATILNEKYGTTLDVELLQIAVDHKLTTWEMLQADAEMPADESLPVRH